MKHREDIRPPDYRRIFEAGPIPAAVLDREFRLVAVNDAYLRVSLRTVEEVVGRNVFEAFPDNPDDP
jgi:PAS domain S-box-containing protein